MVGDCTANHSWINKADIQPSDSVSLNRIVVDNTAIQINDDRRWLQPILELMYSSYSRAFPSINTIHASFLRGLQEKHQTTQAQLLVNAAGHLSAVLSRIGFRFR